MSRHYTTRKTEWLIPLKNPNGRKTGVYVPKEDYEKGRRCIRCGILITKKSKVINKEPLCPFCA